MKLATKRFDKTIPLPKYQKLAAGFDFKCRKGAVIKPGETKVIPSNLAIEVPEGFFLLVAPRSSTWSRLGLIMPHSIGISDPFYRADGQEIALLLYNPTKKPAIIKKGDSIAQGVLLKYEKVEFDETKSLSNSKIGKWKPCKRRS